MFPRYDKGEIFPVKTDEGCLKQGSLRLFYKCVIRLTSVFAEVRIIESDLRYRAVLSRRFGFQRLGRLGSRD